MTSSPNRPDVADIATTIRRQVPISVLMSLGASELRPTVSRSTGHPGLAFKARILPFTKTGDRGTRPRVMDVAILLSPSDTYTVKVGYLCRGEWRDHFEMVDVYAPELANLLLALDYDGDTTLNPRLYLVGW